MAEKTLEQLYAEHIGKVSDKWSVYLYEYERIFNAYRDQRVRLLEIGIQNGGSLEIWSKYFRHAQKLVGCDINPSCASLSYDDPRIAVVVGDANSAAAQANILEYMPAIDVIIDDGSHRSSDIVRSFATYFPYLNDGGVFVAEDLHCGYWREFEGGLFDPFSSITFFKRLADIVNHEHWGIEKERGELLNGFFLKYGFQIEEDVLSHIHSVEFINSMCVIRKAKTECNLLGKRIIAGSVELVVPGHAGLNATLAETPAQAANEWTARSTPPDEELPLRIKDLADRDDQIASLKQAVVDRDVQIVSRNQIVADRDGQIGSLNQVVADRDDQIASLNRTVTAYQNSTSWRITKPLRLVANRVKRIKGGKKDIPKAVEPNGQWSAHLLTQKFRRKLIQKGHPLYRRWLRGTPLGNLIARELLKRRYVSTAELQISALTHGGYSTVSPSDEIEGSSFDPDSGVPGFHLSPPLNFGISPELSLRPHINVLLPSLRLRHMSGGPNTAILLAAYLVESGEAVRLIATDVSVEGEEAALYPHMDKLFLRPIDRERVVLVDGSDRSKPVLIGANDLFLATAWWTAQIAKYAIRKTIYEQFIYLIQDFEPILHEGSTFQARALETYGLPHIPVVNTRLLLDHLIKEGCGCYSQPEFGDRALYFEPAIDRSRYFPTAQTDKNVGTPRRRVLLFYARPTSARRNLFEIGVVALRKAVAAGLLDKDTWEVWGMGEKIDPIPLGNGVFLNSLPWMSFDNYAERVRTADLLLSLMLSPHPSYPPLEMAASGKLVVTNSFSVKTVERMQALSPNILVASPNPDSIAAVLVSAVGRINAGLPSCDPSGSFNLPSSWDESLGGIVARLKERIDTLRRTQSQHAKPFINGYPAVPQSDYERFRRRRLVERRQAGRYRQEAGLLSFVTCAYNTDSKYLEELASSVFGQDGGTSFEWLILDNGSSNESTRKMLGTIARHQCVRLERVEENLGIIGGMRYCLERATGRYILPLDSDDIVEPDCVHILTRFLHETEFPAFLYTDEDKLAGDRFGTPYFKPAWDPVLFLHSCYIAHLCAIDRDKALALDLYSDHGAEGCHDWDSFIRFRNAGYKPLHVPEVLYAWRMHEQSTSGNIGSKSYITDSHRHTLHRFLGHTSTPHIELIHSPLFSYNVDWWFRRLRSSPVSYISVYIERERNGPCTQGALEKIDLSSNAGEGIDQLAEILARGSGELVHLLWDGIQPNDDEWFWESMGVMELFPDTVVVGGTLHDGSKVLDGPRIFGFGKGFDCPDRGRPLSDSGYFAQMWKPHSVSAISSAHCVVRCSFLKEVLPELVAERVPLDILGPWLGGLAREAGKRVVFSPFMGALSQYVPEDRAGSKSWAKFLSRFWHLVPETQFFSPRLSLKTESPYLPATQDEREQHLKLLQHSTLVYTDWLELEIRRRASRYPIRERMPTVSVITTVYEGTNVSLLEELAASISKQTLFPAQWVVVAHGPIPEGPMRYIREKAAAWNATLVVETEPLGIMGAMRRGLHHARSQYVVPVDADDLLTMDAIQILTHEIEKLGQPDLIYSDEDLLIDGKPVAPYLRSSFDPVLNLDSSYIWHLCAIKRESALKFELYTDAEATWCHDWDSVMRVANEGGRIEHIAEILYHWRQHPGSTTNQPDGDPRSLDSVRHILEKQVARTAHPERYSVETWPTSRGAKELYISRRNVDLPKFVWIGDLQSGGIDAIRDENAILVAASNGTIVDAEPAFNEVARLLELHPSVGAVGGRVLDASGRVIDGCLVTNRTGELESPWLGHLADDAGPFALALKPQIVASVGTSLAFFRIQALKAIRCEPAEPGASLGIWLCATCARLFDTDWKVVYSPLVCARTTKVGATARQVLNTFHPNRSTNVHALARYGRLCPHDFRWVPGALPDAGQMKKQRRGLG